REHEPDRSREPGLRRPMSTRGRSGRLPGTISYTGDARRGTAPAPRTELGGVPDAAERLRGLASASRRPNVFARSDASPEVRENEPLCVWPTAGTGAAAALEARDTLTLGAPGRSFPLR